MAKPIGKILVNTDTIVTVCIFPNNKAERIQGAPIANRILLHMGVREENAIPMTVQEATRLIELLTTAVNKIQPGLINTGSHFIINI